MQSQQTQSTKSSPGSTRYWLAAVIVLFLTSVTLASLLKIKHESYLAFESKTTILTNDLRQHLHDANELAQQRQEEIDLSKEQQQALSTELAASLSTNEELTKQVSESKTETANQSKRADIAEEQLKIDADSAEILSKLIHSTFSRLYRKQKKDPDFSAVNLLDYTTSRLKSVARRKSPLAEARIRSQFAWIYYNSVKDYEGSQKQATLASDSLKQLLGDDHLDTIDSLQQLANAMHQQGKYELAVNTFNEALSGARKQYGDDHKETLQVLEYLVTPLEGLKKFDDLVVARQEILRIKKLKSSGRRDYLHYSKLHLGMALRETGRYKEAEAIFRELLKSRLKYSGLDDKKTFEAKACLAWTLRLQDKLEEAERLHKEFTSLATFMFAINKPFAHQIYGRYLTYLGNYDVAERYLLRNFKPNPKSDYTAKSVERNPAIDALIELYEAWGKPEEAEKMRKQLVVPDLNSG